MNHIEQSSAGPADELVLPVALRLAEGCDGFTGTPMPTLCWHLAGEREGIVQHAFQLQVAADADFSAPVADTGLCAGTLPAASAWPAPLTSRQVRWARVRVQTDAGLTGWSAPLRIEAALLERGDWVASPVSPLSNVDQADPRPVPYLRHRFMLDRPVASARLYVTALGVHDSWINGERVTDALLDPGWTAYEERLLYAAHDVTGLLRPGENVLAAAVGDGWWRGWLTWMERRAIYGTTTAYLAQLEIRYADGTTQIVASDESWRGGEGALRGADLYNGCTLDLRAEPAGWREAGFDDTAWEAVTALPLPAGLELRPMPPVRIVEEWPVKAVAEGAGRWRIDVGQNLSGHLRLRVRGTAGSRITLRHAEMLDRAGDLYTAPLRNAEATDRFILADDSLTLLEPTMTFHGFRYAGLECDGPLAIEDVTVCVLSSDLPQIGRFACSDPRIERLFANVRWSQRGNFLALPTDCPQRDERLGWTGDIQVFADTACLIADTDAFLSSWLRDLEIEQRADGNVPSTVPNVIDGHEFEYGGVGWGDAATLVPWSLYQAYGDRQVLARQIGSMRRWVDWGASRRNSAGVWLQDFHLGDWLDPGAPSDQPEKATTDPNFIATAYLSRSAAVVAAALAVLGQEDEGLAYVALARDAATAAWRTWGSHAVTTQAGCALALQFNIAPAAERSAVGAALAGLVDRQDGRIATGFLGTPLVLPALTAEGQVEAAYRLLLNEQCPGWLYQVRRGATTMWERWDAVDEDGNPGAGEMSSGGGSSMISFNHYAYGAVAAWLFNAVAGISGDPEAPGYAGLVFAPQPGGGLTHAAGEVDTPFGRSGIAWRISGERMEVELRIAPGATGRFVVPHGWHLAQDPPVSGGSFGSGRHTLTLGMT